MNICPIMSSFTDVHRGCLTRCRENECALWNNGCAIVRAADALTVLSAKNESNSTLIYSDGKPTD